MVKYFVKENHTLGYVDDRQPTLFNILSGNPIKGGHDWKDGFVALSPLDVLVSATQADFDTFRVCSKGHIQ